MHLERAMLVILTRRRLLHEYRSDAKHESGTKLNSMQAPSTNRIKESQIRNKHFRGKMSMKISNGMQPKDAMPFCRLTRIKILTKKLTSLSNSAGAMAQEISLLDGDATLVTQNRP